MRWPSWLSTKPADTDNDNDKPAKGTPAPPRSQSATPPVSWSTSLNTTDWTQLTSPRAIIPSVLLTVTTLALLRLYKLHLRRIPSSAHIKPGFFRKRTLFGYASSVGDGDNFRFFHTPGGRLAGWGWLRRRHLRGPPTRNNTSTSTSTSTTSTTAAKSATAATKSHGPGSGGGYHIKDTIHIRIAGIDAPERAHFGRPAQPFGDEALSGLKTLVLHRYVRCRIWRRDQYDRVVASVGIRTWWGGSRDLGLEMLKRGLATVYEAKFGAEFGDLERVYREAEAEAKRKRLGLWAAAGRGAKEPGFLGRLLGEKKREGEALETPRQYKERMAALEKK